MKKTYLETILKLTNMKKLIIAFTALLTFAVQANAMSYEQARQQALFLADKMAYELNLTEEQYEAAYEINLDYLMSVNSQADLYGTYWERRNLDLSYILLDWQYRAFVEATYFYRPLYWSGGFWHFGIYARYPHRSYFYFGTPHFYAVYRGGHSWRMNGGHSWYHGRDWGHSRYVENRGMRSGFNRGDYGRGSQNFGNGSKNHAGNNGNGRSFGNGTNRGIQHNGNFGNNKTSFGNGGSFDNGGSFSNGVSSTRTTANRPSSTSKTNSSSFGSLSRSGSATPRNTFTPDNSSRSTSSGSHSSSFGGSSSRSISSGIQSSFGGSPSRSVSFGSGASNGRSNGISNASRSNASGSNARSSFGGRR